MRLAGGSPQADLHATREGSPQSAFWNPRGSRRGLYGRPTVCMYVGFQTETHFKPRASPQAELWMYVRPWRLPASRITTREAPHKQNYDQGSSPQAELRPGRLPTSRITTREPTHKQNYDQGTGWLAGWRNYDQGACPALGWLAGWGAGWLAG